MIYPYRCAACGHQFEIHQRLKEYEQKPLIPECCGRNAQRVFTVPLIAPDYQQPFVSHLDGSVISSRSQQKEHMLKHGVALYDDIASDLPRRQQEKVAAQVAEIRADVNESITKVLQGYVPAQSEAGQDQSGVDVVNTHALPKEAKNDAVVDV